MTIYRCGGGVCSPFVTAVQPASTSQPRCRRMTSPELTTNCAWQPVAQTRRLSRQSGCSRPTWPLSWTPPMMMMMTLMIATASTAALINRRTSALTLVRRSLEAQDDAANGFTLVAELEELCGRCLSTSMKQASIKNYFQPL